MKTDIRVSKRIIVIGCMLMSLWAGYAAAAYPVTFMDSEGKTVFLEKPPRRVVCLIPSVTEIMFRLGVKEPLKGITYHTVSPWEANDKTVVGGFFSPDTEAIERLNPDVIIHSPIHSAVIRRFDGSACMLMNLKIDSVEDGLDTISLLGRIFNREAQARDVRDGIRRDMDLVAEKLRLSGVEKKRVIRLMGRDRIMTPGGDSFQNQLIALAGGIPPDLGPGDVVTVSQADWQAFNPEIIYGCAGDDAVAKTFFSRPGWKDVDAVRNQRIYYFPCDLTCRASTNTGYFIKWLAACIYGTEFGDSRFDVRPNRVVSVRTLDTELAYVKDAKIKESRVHDLVNRSLVIRFTEPMTVISTLDGPLRGIMAVGNHYIPPASWLLNHDKGLDVMKKEILDTLKLDPADTSFLFTGADMNNLSVKTERFRDIVVKVFATAGVDGNAMRVSRDTGGFYEPGTVNLIVMANHELSQRAMTRAIICATEGKTAALLDLDIRSSYQGARYRATGTGTDNVMVVQGRGRPVLDKAGGHTRLGELVGRCVYRAVTEAVKKQNGITPSRNIFWRLKKRGITVYGLVAEKEWCDCNRSMHAVAADVEKLLLDPRYMGFVEAALAMSDDYEKGWIRDLDAFDTQCLDIASAIAARTVDKLEPLITRTNVPLVIEKAMNALFNGVARRGEGM